jgi:hypothetical protein
MHGTGGNDTLVGDPQAIDEQTVAVGSANGSVNGANDETVYSNARCWLASPETTC